MPMYVCVFLAEERIDDGFPSFEGTLLNRRLSFLKFCFFTLLFSIEPDRQMTLASTDLAAM